MDEDLIFQVLAIVSEIPWLLRDGISCRYAYGDK